MYPAGNINRHMPGWMSMKKDGGTCRMPLNDVGILEAISRLNVLRIKFVDASTYKHIKA
jgi:hypothetical protein